MQPRDWDVVPGTFPPAPIAISSRAEPCICANGREGSACETALEGCDGGVRLLVMGSTALAAGGTTSASEPSTTTTVVEHLSWTPTAGCRLSLRSRSRRADRSSCPCHSRVVRGSRQACVTDACPGQDEAAGHVGGRDALAAAAVFAPPVMGSFDCSRKRFRVGWREPWRSGWRASRDGQRAG